MYFGKTTKPDPYKYHGSGTYWTRHIKKHGKEHIITLWVSDLYFDTSITKYALHFSYENAIVESKDWANLIPENGFHTSIPCAIKINLVLGENNFIKKPMDNKLIWLKMTVSVPIPFR